MGSTPASPAIRKRQIAGWSSLVARQAHNLKVVGSNPAPATKFSFLAFCRTVAQPGSAFAWGAKGLGFKSRRSDQFFLPLLMKLTPMVGFTLTFFTASRGSTTIHGCFLRVDSAPYLQGCKYGAENALALSRKVLGLSIGKYTHFDTRNTRILIPEMRAFFLRAQRNFSAR